MSNGWVPRAVSLNAKSSSRGLLDPSAQVRGETDPG